jgi:rod shape-determining protein MreC
MPRRTRRARRARRGTTIALLVVASIAIITLDYRGQAHGVISGAKRGAHDALAPVQRGVDALVRPVGSFLSGAVHGGDLEAQNAKLRREVGDLQRQTLITQSTRNSLRAALSPSDFAATVQLDKGSTNGVTVGMPVVGGAGLVGQVIEVWSSGCTVRLVTDVASSVGVRFGTGGNLALVQGAGGGRNLAVNLIAPGTTLHRGEVFTTSGLQNAQFPPDIPVAAITSFSSTPSATQETVSARPLADLSVLQYVDVLLWQSSP